MSQTEVPTFSEFFAYMQANLSLPEGSYNANFIDVDLGSDRTSFSHSVGKLVGKIVGFFRRDETKTSALISYWTVETILTAIIVANLTSAFAIACALFIYFYGTYALYSAVKALVKDHK